MRVASYKSMQVLYNVNSYYKWKVQLKITFIDKHDMAAFNFLLHPWPPPIPCVKNRNDLLCNHMNNFRPHKGGTLGCRRLGNTSVQYFWKVSSVIIAPFPTWVYTSEIGIVICCHLKLYDRLSFIIVLKSDLSSVQEFCFRLFASLFARSTLDGTLNVIICPLSWKAVLNCTL